MLKQITAQEALQAHMQGKAFSYWVLNGMIVMKPHALLGASLSRKTTTFRVKFPIIKFSSAWMGKESAFTSYD